MSQESYKMPEGVCAILIICGAVLLGAGMITLLYAAVTVYQVMHNPADVPFVHMLQEKITLTDLGFSGKSGTNEFEFKSTEPVRYILFFWLGLLALSIMVRIFSGLVTTGGTLMRLGAEGRGERRPDKPDMVA
ncbi:MAG: hypothetical protein ACAH80_11380 [Alphaproteobacteria bacterium]